MLSTILRSLCLAIGLLAAVDAQANARRFTDEKAGISYPLISSGMRPKSTQELSKLNNAPAAKAARITYTSGYTISKKNTPYLLVWTMPIDSQLTKSAINSLQDGEQVFRLLGIKDWRFDLKRLRGRGTGQRTGAVRSELLLQVLKNRYVYVGFFYELDEQLQEWRRIKAGIQPLANFGVSYDSLPANAASSALSSAGKGALIGALLGGMGFLAWWLFNRQKRSGSGVSSRGDSSGLAA